MSNLEHLVENGLHCLKHCMDYKEWHERMKSDCNWAGNENITLDNLWEICQYVICTWGTSREQEETVICGITNLPCCECSPCCASRRVRS